MAFTISINDQAAFEVLFAGPAGPTGPQGPQGIQGVPGQGVPVGGTTGQVLAKVDGVNYNTEWITPQDEYAVWGGITGTLSAQLDLQAALDGKYSTTNPDGFITASALTPYLTISSAASTYQPLSGMSSYLTKAGNLTGLTDLALARDNLQLGTLNSPTFAGVTVQGAGANVAQLTSTALSLNHTGYGQFTIQPSVGITFPNGSIQTTAFTAALLSGYATESWVTAGFAPLARGLPASGTVGQVLTKNSGTSYDASWATLIPGDRYLTSSTTSNTIGNGNKTFTIGTGLSYTPTQSITISYDASNHMHGEVLTYNSGTGVLTVDINHHTGSGTYAAWVVNVGGVVPAASVAWGAITGALGDQSDLATALNAKLASADAATTYQTISGMSSYLSKAGNLSGLASTSTARTNLGLGTISTFNDAPSDGSQYARKNGAWDVVTGGGGSSLPVVQIAASAIDPTLISLSPSTVCIPLTYPSHTDVLNGLYATSLNYSNDETGNHSLILSGLTSLTGVVIGNNDSMTSLPDFTGLANLTTAVVSNNDLMATAPDFTDLANLSNVTVQNNPSMTAAPDFTGCVGLTSVNVSSNVAMTAAPDFTSCTALITVFVVSNDAMTSAPDFAGLTYLDTAQVYYNPVMTSAPDFSGCTALTSVNVSNNSTMSSAPDFTDCTSLNNVTVAECAISDTNLLTMCAQIYDGGAQYGTLSMEGGTNGSFDGQNLPTEITDLQGIGWSVTFNDNNPP